MDPGVAIDEQRRLHPSPVGTTPPAPVVRVVAESWLKGRLDRRRDRRAADEHGRLGFPAVGACSPASTPTVENFAVTYTVTVIAILDRAVARALPLRMRRAELLETLRDLEQHAARARDALDDATAGADEPSRERRRGEDHLTDAQLADRARRERVAAHRAAAAEERNLRALCHRRRVDVAQVDELLDDVATAAQAQAAMVRCVMLERLHDYRDALVRRHPDGQLINDLDWPTAFAEPPAWVDDARTAQQLICGRARDVG